jgi:Zn-dependent M32 family carboxypeptidase
LVTETFKDLRKGKEDREVLTQEALTPSPRKSLSRRKMIIKALRSLRKEKEARDMVAKKVLTPSPNKSLNEQTLLTKIEILKQEVEEYKILDRHIKAENVELKEQQQRSLPNLTRFCD